MVSGSIKKLFSLDYVNIYFTQSVVFVNIYLFLIFFSTDFTRWERVELPHIAYIVRYSLTLKAHRQISIK